MTLRQKISSYTKKKEKKRSSQCLDAADNKSNSSATVYPGTPCREKGRYRGKEIRRQLCTWSFE
jgi:hypothetical protein